MAYSDWNDATSWDRTVADRMRIGGGMGSFGGGYFAGQFGPTGYYGTAGNIEEGGTWAQRGDERWSTGARRNFAGVGPKNYRRSDARVREEVNERLTWHDDIDATDVEVQVQDGEVTLSGVVEDRAAKRLAEDIVEDISGVRDVHNKLKVRHGFLAALTGEKATERDLAATEGGAGRTAQGDSPSVRARAATGI